MNDMSALYERFFDYSSCIKENTDRSIEWFREVLGYFHKQMGIQSPKDITIDCIEIWLIKGKKKKGWCAKTRRTRLQALRSFCDWLVQKKYLKENPAREISLPRLPKTLPNYLTEDQAEDLLQFTKHYRYSYLFDKARAYAIIATFIFTGIRLNELVHLQLNHIDIKERMLSVKNGKGAKDRNIPFCGRLAKILEDYLIHRKRLNKSCNYFFTAMRQDSKMGKKVVPRLIRKLRESSGIKCNPHLLRHTFAVLMVQGGCDIYHLAEMLGHGDIKTTTIYLSAAVNHLKKISGKHPLNDF